MTVTKGTTDMTDIINLNDNNLLRQKSASEVSTLTATLVQDEQRVGFWPQHFGNIPQWIILEPTVFAWMNASARTTAAASGIFIR